MLACGSADDQDRLHRSALKDAILIKDHHGSLLPHMIERGSTISHGLRLATRQPDESGVLASIVQGLEGRLPIVPVPVFGCAVCLLRGCGRVAQPGVPGGAPAPTAPGRVSFLAGGMVRAGQAGAGGAQSRCQQNRNASFHGQSGLISGRARGRGGRAWRGCARSGSGTCPGRLLAGQRRRGGRGGSRRPDRRRCSRR
jgi:hypothetical protein